MKIIFLDIDGVLNNQRWARVLHNLYGGKGYGGMFRTINPKWQDVKWDWYNVANLKHLLGQTKAKIVISSSWRRFHTLDQFKRMFQLYGLPQKAVIGETTLKTAPGAIRGDQINKYIADNPDIDNYVILDDNSDFYSGQNLVQTDMQFGLTDKDVLIAISTLNRGR
jgi:hypothetical protein